jgi:hypothetical protein
MTFCRRSSPGAYPSPKQKTGIIFLFSETGVILRLFQSSAARRRKGKADMDADTEPKPARPRLNPYTKALRRERIFARLSLGWSYDKIAREEGVSDRRVRQIVADALRRQELDDPTDHAIIQLMRLDAAHELAARAVDSGDLKAIDPLLKVLERMDRYHKAAARKAVYDDAARKRLFEKLNRVAAGFTVAEAPAGLEPSNPDGERPHPETLAQDKEQLRDDYPPEPVTF